MASLVGPFSTAGKEKELEEKEEEETSLWRSSWATSSSHGNLDILLSVSLVPCLGAA